MKYLGMVLVILIAASHACGEEIYQDFRDKDLDVKLFRRTGAEAGERIRTEPQGLRMTLPADPMTKTLGFNTRAPTKGNFEITVGYEILQADRPKTGSGLGLEIYVNTDTPTQEALILYRMVKPKEGEVYLCDKKWTSKEDKRETKRTTVPAGSKSGQLRLTRMGKEVTYWAAEGADKEFKELCKYTWDDMDVKGIAVRAWGSQNVVDLRITEIRIRDEMAPAAENGLAKDLMPKPAANPQPQLGATWLLWVLSAVAGAMLLAVVLLAALLWLLRGRGRDALPVATITFFCSGCGKTLKTKANSIGKTIKCPGCGIAATVPDKVAHQ